ncbi:polyamine ABC transporter substrate-binding protein [Celeribacter baekdonensis]|uniref:Putrescine-binding periplasmic protein n=1 Tax=Celeribacter baekdonensis TaxID=875171 RepID=A0A2R4M5D3_9RHOB|nr:polyamine ABC transporter substrate-binding protein [Celeribacter baekdonensis]AVW92401.1 spermidine/putrescine ABC transporter substrate-binding protein PotF [Celeribacter baekdonensis]
MKLGLTAAVAACALAQSAAAQSTELNVYNWSDYIAEDTIANFEAETGISVNYDVFDSNEVLEAKLLTGTTGYDVVVPSIEFMARQIQAGVFAPIPKDQLENYGNLDPTIMKVLEVNDPNNTYGIPYMMFTTGIGYNVTEVAARIDADKIGSWDMIFDPETTAKLADCGIALLDSPTEVLAPALNYLGLDPNTEDSGDLKKAEDLMLSIRPYVRYFHSSQYINDIANGEICVALGYSGDILQARDRASEAGQGVDVAYVIPREGAQIGFDMLTIPDDAPNKDNAVKFLDYILRPEVVSTITNYVYYANPNTAATAFVDDTVRNDPGIYPPQEVKEKLFSLRPHTQRFDRTLTRAWTTIKTGQ